MVSLVLALACGPFLAGAGELDPLQGEWRVLQARWEGGKYVYEPGSSLVVEGNRYVMTIRGEQLAVQTGAITPVVVFGQKALLLHAGGECYPCAFARNDRYLYLHFEQAGVVYTLVARRPLP